MTSILLSAQPEQLPWFLFYKSTRDASAHMFSVAVFVS